MGAGIRSVCRQGNLPDLEFVRFMHDHEGNFSNAIDGINTPEKETADNDYAVGKLIERVAHSPYASFDAHLHH